MTKYHFAAYVDCGLNGQLRTPSLCPNRSRARTLEAHGYYWRSHIRGPHQRHDTEYSWRMAIDSTSYINVPSLCDGQKIAAAAICDFPLESLKNLFSFQGETYCYYLGQSPLPRRARLVTGLKMPKKDHLGLIQQGVDAWNTWRERAAAQSDLSRADLTKADLREADLRKANLYKANLSEADLSKPLMAGRTLARRIS